MLGVLGRLWGGPVLYRGGGVEVRERQGVRTLHLDSDTIQSAMRVDHPHALELSYTRAMMALLLFAPSPRSALLIGLGGGSLAKFIYHSMPETRLEVVELNPTVVEVAHAHFELPAPSRRLAIHIGDGAQHVAECQKRFDAILVDAYDGRSLAASLGSESFFAAARAALSARGVLAMNLWSNDRAFDRNLQRIESGFDGLCLCLPAERPGNIIAFAFAQRPPYLGWTDLRDRAGALQESLGLEFPRFVLALRQMNRVDSVGVRFAAEAPTV